MEARAGARQFTPFNDLARGGTVARSIAFRNIPGPSVPPKGKDPLRENSERTFVSSPELDRLGLYRGELDPWDRGGPMPTPDRFGLRLGPQTSSAIWWGS